MLIRSWGWGVGGKDAQGVKNEEEASRHPGGLLRPGGAICRGGLNVTERRFFIGFRAFGTFGDKGFLRALFCSKGFSQKARGGLRSWELTARLVQSFSLNLKSLRVRVCRVQGLRVLKLEL